MQRRQNKEIVTMTRITRRSGITTPSSNSGLSHNEMHVFKIAGIVSMVTALLL